MPQPNNSEIPAVDSKTQDVSIAIKELKTFDTGRTLAEVAIRVNLTKDIGFEVEGLRLVLDRQGRGVHVLWPQRLADGNWRDAVSLTPYLRHQVVGLVVRSYRDWVKAEDVRLGLSDDAHEGPPLPKVAAHWSEAADAANAKFGGAK